MSKYIFIFASFILLSNAYSQNTANYTQEIADWDAQRVTDLKAANGWLNLAGLFWLEEGKNTFGSGSQNNVVFPANTINANAGYFLRTGNTVKVVAENNTPILIDGRQVSQATIFSPELENPPVVSSGSLRWFIIKRDDKIGVRLRDLNSPAITAFKGIERYKAKQQWKVTATLQQAPADSMMVTNKIGQTTRQKSPGRLVFTLKGKQYGFDVLDDGDNMLLIVFADATTGKTTYPSGRFIAVKSPGIGGTVQLDFNKAYNPPCAFTDFATCPLPPPQNHMAIAVKAGEKNYVHHKN